RVLALAMTMMLASSFLLCVTIVPWFGARTPRAAERPSRAGRRLERSVDYAVSHRWVAVVPLVHLVLAILPLERSLGTGFLPEMDEGSLILDYIAPAGTSLGETDRILREVEAEIDRTPEIASWSRRTGDQL